MECQLQRCDRAVVFEVAAIKKEAEAFGSARSSAPSGLMSPPAGET